MLGKRLAVALFISLLFSCRRAPAPPDPPPIVVAAPPAPPPLPALPLEPESGARESGGLALARIQGRAVAFVADEDDRAIVEVDLEERRVVRSTPIETRPRDLLVLPDGTLAATLPEANAVAAFARTSSGLREERRVVLPNEPLAMALPPGDAPALYVSTGASHALVRLRLEGNPFAVERRWDLPREPRAVLVGHDGARVFVAHAAEGVVSVVPADGDREVVRTDIGSGPFCSSMGFCTAKRQARYGQALVRSGERGVAVPVVQTLPNPPVVGITKPMKAAVMPMPFDDDPFAPTSVSIPGSSRGGSIRGYGVGDGSSGPPMFMRLVSVDETGGRAKGLGVLDTDHSTCLEPRAAIAIGDRVLVACMGSKRIEDLRDGSTRQRISVPAGPTALALVRGEQAAVVWSSFERKLSRISLVPTGKDARKNAQLPAAEELAALPRTVERDAAWLRGRELFFGNGNPAVSGDGRACASCHIDGRDDGLTWDTPKGKRRTRTLAGQLARAPYGWLGEHATLEAHVRITFKQLGGRGLPPNELEDLLTYVRSLPAPAPAAAPPEPSGKQLFVRAECDGCHVDGGSDRGVHDVGTGSGFMTPTLVGIGSRRQLMHDGRFASLDDLIAKSTAMGSGSALSIDERRTLVAYLQTL